jgi:hypothetical protein
MINTMADPANSNSGLVIAANFKINCCLKKSCRRSSTGFEASQGPAANPVQSRLHKF